MNWELFLKLGLTVLFTATWVVGVWWIWTSHLDPWATLARFTQKATSPPEWVVTRDPNKIYQGSRIVGEVSGPVQRKDGAVHFARLSNTTGFDSKQPFEYQRLKLRIVRVGTIIGMKVDVSDAGTKTLTGVYEDVQCQVLE